MARPFRYRYSGAIYHVTARGNERRPIFRDDQDRRRFLEKLQALTALHHVPVYAYVLMPNHYHLVVCTPRANLSSFMQQLNTSFTVYFNRRHRRSGHLFGGRFKARLVEGGEYLVSLSRYVHLNPVKVRAAGALPAAERGQLLTAYRWSSFPGLAGLTSPEDWVDPEVLRGFGGAGSLTARSAYREYVLEKVEAADEPLLAGLARSSRALGSETFLRDTERRLREARPRLARWVDISGRRVEAAPSPERVAAAVAAAYGLDSTVLARRGNNEARDVWMKLLREVCGLTNREIGRRLGHADGATVGKRLRTLSGQDRHTVSVNSRCQRIMAAIANCKA